MTKLKQKNKLLLAALGATVPFGVVASLVACGAKSDDTVKPINQIEKEKKQREEREQEQKDKVLKEKFEPFKRNEEFRYRYSRQMLGNYVMSYDWSKLLTGHGPVESPIDKIYQQAISESSNSQRSTLAERVINDQIVDLEYVPYADIGIVRDTVEYILKDKAIPGAYRSEIQGWLDKKGYQNANYNDLAQFKKDGIANKFNVGFMQNAMDSMELKPAWNAVNPDDANESGKWFEEQRWNQWVKDGVNPEDLTITFGPFANAFWHTAYLNNYTEYQLAEQFKEIAKKWGTKSFDFYFSAPYNRKSSTEYASSVRLLAGSLKILLEQDPSFKVRLSLVTGRDGLNIGVEQGKFDPADGPSRIGDDIYPLYEFTRFLGINFNLNLVAGYIQPTDEINDKGQLRDQDWEFKAIKNKMLPNSLTAFTELLKGHAPKLFESNKITDKLIRNRVSITPWIGVRSEKAAYNFGAEDALKLRQLAQELGLHSISNFYVSRDNPSLFIQGGQTAHDMNDQNPLDPNLRNSRLYPAGTFSKIFNGKFDKLTDLPKELDATTNKDMKSLAGFFDYKWTQGDADLEAILTEIRNESVDWDGGHDNSQIENQVHSKFEKVGKHLTWFSANPLRKDSITVKEPRTAGTKTVYSPYVDMGLWPLVDLREITKTVPDLKHLTLAFVQQDNVHDDKVDLSFAGYYKPTKNGNAINDDFINSHLVPKILQPAKEAGIFQNLTVSYGGFNTGDNEKNPWHTALRQANNQINEAAEILKRELEEFNFNLAKLVGLGKDQMSYKIDFDIEGAARTRINELKTLFSAMAHMKKSNPKWEFSLTLPVLPDGLIKSEENMLDILASLYKVMGNKPEDMPVINIMAMDYGVGIYNQALKDGKTNFDLARSATERTHEQVLKAINSHWSNNKLKDAWSKVGVTPMIGVNDHKNGVFTLEDAKEFYNWAMGEKNLAYVGIWSLNSDSPSPYGKDKPSAKTINSNGLNYLNKYDFSNAFLGNWTPLIQKPERNPYKLTDEDIAYNLLRPWLEKKNK